ncbi:MAG: PKD domain-containing protein [Acidobacteriota bacterium]|nr:PKD domain-containing protein [Acidobacteriota bacterium]
MPRRILSRSLALLCFVLLLTPPAALASSHGVTIHGFPATMEPNKTYTFTVSSSTGDCCSSAAVKLSYPPAVTASPAFYTFSGSFTRTITMTTGSNPGSVTVVATMTLFGSDYTASASGTIVAPQGTSTLSAAPVFPSGLARQVTLQLSRPATSATTFNLNVGGTGAVGALIPASVTVAAGQTQSFFNVTGGNQGDAVITAKSASADFTHAAPLSVKIAGTIGFVGTNFCCVAAGGTTNLNIGLMTWVQPFGPQTTTIPFDVAMTLGGTTGSTLSASTFSYANGDTAKILTVNGGSQIGDATVTFSTSSPYVLTSVTYGVRVRGTISVQGAPSSLSTGQTSGPITLRLSHPSINTFSVNLVLSGSIAGASVSTPSVTFLPGEQTKTFTVTAGTNGGGLQVRPQLAPQPAPPAPPISYYFEQPGPSNINVISGAPTPAGSNITVQPPLPPGATVPLKVTYGEVTTAGTTTQTNVTVAFQPPSGYEIPGSALQFRVNTTATVSAPVTVCGTYPVTAADDPTELRLFKKTAEGWADVTSGLDAANRQLCGELLSLGDGVFAIFRLNSPPVVAAITGPTDVVKAGEPAQFSATFTDADAADVHTGVWVGNDEAIGAAVITKVDGVWTATGNLAFTTAGTHRIYLVIRDGGNASFSPEFEVTVDAAPPVIESVTATPGFLWPPNNKMHGVVLTVSATDDVGTPVCAISGVSMAGITSGDYSVTGSLTLELKATHFNAYAITVTCTDSVGRTAAKAVTVTVDKPKDKKDK